MNSWKSKYCAATLCNSLSQAASEERIRPNLDAHLKLDLLMWAALIGITLPVLAIRLAFAQGELPPPEAGLGHAIGVVQSEEDERSGISICLLEVDEKDQLLVPASGVSEVLARTDATGKWGGKKRSPWSLRSSYPLSHRTCQDILRASRRASCGLRRVDRYFRRFPLSCRNARSLWDDEESCKQGSSPGSSPSFRKDSIIGTL